MAIPELERLRAALDLAVHGQDDAKLGLLLALIAREHAYLEGPPGCGKSALARALASGSGARRAELAFHRDANAAELLGEVHLRRESRAAGERIAIELAVGPSASAEVLLLDDLSRAPGEALGLLLRVLAERRLGECPLPLETAIATAGPSDLESYADPLEPTQLDRFAIQLRLRGLVGARRFALARALLDRELEASPPPLDTEMRHSLQRRAAALPIEPAARAALLRAVERLAVAAGSETALLSDRAFARAAPAVLRAHALLRGGERVTPEDVRALRFMLARRVPEALEPEIPALLEDAIRADPEADRGAPGTRPAAAADRTGNAPGAGGGPPSATLPVESLEARNTSLASVPPAASARGDDDAAGVESLTRALAGRLERGAVERGDDAGGSPRSFRRMRRLDEILDADPVEALLLVEGRQPGGARVYRRERRNAGGAIAVLRDVSASMEGRLARWAGQVVAGLVRVGARRRMRLGYIEFNHESERFASGGVFFHRRYRRVLALAQRRRAEGRTNYEAPLRTALGELRSTAGRERHIVLLSDGVPVLGDPTVRNERALARRLRVKVHTVFLGSGECPAVLDEISRETGGLRFEARPGPGGRVTLRERDERR